MFNNLAPWGEKKFVSELKRTYKFQRVVNNRLDCHANQTRILSKEYSFVAGDYVRSTARKDVKRHTEDNSPKYRMVDEILSILRFFTVQTRITTHHSLKRPGATHVALCDSVGSYFRHWCGAFTLAEVLITLGIIGVVAAMTLPSLVQNYRKSVVENKLKSEYSLIFNAIRMSEAKNGSSEDWATCDEDNSFECTKSFFDTYLAPELKTVKICGNDNKEECWTEPVSLTGKKGYLSPLIDNKGLTAILSNGTSLYMWAGGQNSEAAHLQIWFDIDGPTKGKGIIGADVFGTITFFKAREEIPAGTFMQGGAKLLDVDNYKNDTEYGCSKYVDTPWAGFYCGVLIQQNGWKIPKDYPVRL